MTTKPTVKYVTISDIHLNNLLNPTVNIINNLKVFLESLDYHPIFNKFDILFIAGDLFDSVFLGSDDNFYEVLIFVNELIAWCKKKDILLRVLEGTPSHDCTQSKVFELLSRLNLLEDGRVKWIDSIEIEHLKNFELDILYIPDAISLTTEITQTVVKNILDKNNLTKVDIAIMHGMFGYQMKDIPGKHDVHSEDFYLNIVRHFINIGHIHTFSYYHRIIAQGSFDRLRHGEEEVKGGIGCVIRDPVNQDYFEFLPNHKSMIFKTLTFTKESLDKSLKVLKKVINQHPGQINIRIVAPKTHAIYSSLPELKKQYPFVAFTKLSVDTEESSKNNQKSESQFNYSAIQITKENIVSFITQDILDRKVLNFEDMEELKNTLERLHE